MLFQGDCLEVLRTIASDSLDSMVTDPPAGISFMSKKWDDDKGGRDEWIKWMTDVMTETHRVLKPGAHGLVWALPRTSHWTATALENAGFEVRDVVHHAFGTGFPKSHNIYKSLTSIGVDADKWRGYGTALKPSIERWILCRKPTALEESSEKTDTFNALEWDETFLSIETLWNNVLDAVYPRGNMSTISTVSSLITELRILNCLISASTPALITMAKTIQNGDLLIVSNAIDSLKDVLQKLNVLRTISVQEHVSTLADVSRELIKSLPKIENVQMMEPLFEDYILVRKPCSEKTVAKNVLKHGTGGINIDECRVEGGERLHLDATAKITPSQFGAMGGSKAIGVTTLGRFPSNLILDEAAAEMLDEQSGNLPSGGKTPFKGKNALFPIDNSNRSHFKENGGASRFFYVAKASKSDRNAGLEGMPLVEKKTLGSFGDQSNFDCPDGANRAGDKGSSKQQNHHPTVKSTALMQYLIKLVTPSGGTVLDPFMGSGSTGVAAKALGFGFVGIEREQEYFEIAKKRIEA